MKIYSATRADSGVYTFRVTGVDGRTEEQPIYVDISEKKKKKKRDRKERRRKIKRRRRQRLAQKSKNVAN